MTTVLDPTNESTPAQIERAMRPESLAGLTVGLLDISKPRGNVFLDRVEERLAAFIDAAQAQSDALGFDPSRLFVEHPIQDRTDDEMRAIADQAVDQLIMSISGP